MARRLTDTYFVRYSMTINGIRTDGVKKDVNRDGVGVFVIDEYDSIISGIIKILDMELRAEYHFYDTVPYISNLSIKEIRPL